tara:strand:+ start:115 stop:447 length:333 start_codon:yes stop_codon:yes gene_type:complete
MLEQKQLHFYIDSDWDFKPPVVRIWVDGYLITERAVTPQKKLGEYLEEVVTLKLKKGLHIILVENIKTALADIELMKIMVETYNPDKEIKGFECPFTTKDGITYQARLEI